MTFIKDRSTTFVPLGFLGFIYTYITKLNQYYYKVKLLDTFNIFCVDKYISMLKVIDSKEKNIFKSDIYLRTGLNHVHNMLI